MEDCKLKTNKSSQNNDGAPVNVDEIKTKISTLFFDLDNTLIPTRSGDLRAIRKLTDVLENQFSFSKEESCVATQSFLKSFRRCPDNSQTSLDSWRTFLWREALPNRYKHLAEQVYPKWLKLRYRYLALPAEHVQMLRRFREAGYLLALITNGPSNAQWEKIKQLNLGQYFDCILVSSDLPWEKPNPNIFFAACDFLRVNPSECVMVGDKIETDIKGACLAKLSASFWIPLNSAEINLDGVTFKPNFILKNLLEMCKYFPTCLNGNGLATTSAAAAAAAASAGAAGGICFNFRRRRSQISCSATGTCDSDLRHRNNIFHQYQSQRHRQQINKKYRRSGSLPSIEYLNSETENSSDSIFS